MSQENVEVVRHALGLWNSGEQMVEAPRVL